MENGAELKLKKCWYKGTILRCGDLIIPWEAVQE